MQDPKVCSRCRFVKWPLQQNAEWQPVQGYVDDLSFSRSVAFRHNWLRVLRWDQIFYPLQRHARTKSSSASAAVSEAASPQSENLHHSTFRFPRPREVISSPSYSRVSRRLFHPLISLVRNERGSPYATSAAT